MQARGRPWPEQVGYAVLPTDGRRIQCQILADDRLRDLLWDCQLKGGFEDALAELNPYQCGIGTTFSRSECGMKLGLRAVGWMESEVREWLAMRAEAREATSPTR
jgi:Prophage CP4-57 regulatory protein (AlpA)